jgi:hypothetical protein
MSETSSARRENRREAPLPGKRLERFAQRYVNSPIKLDIMRTVRHYLNGFYTMVNLQHFVEAPSPDVARESAVLLSRYPAG